LTSCRTGTHSKQPRVTSRISINSETCKRLSRTCLHGHLNGDLFFRERSTPRSLCNVVSCKRRECGINVVSDSRNKIGDDQFTTFRIHVVGSSARRRGINVHDCCERMWLLCATLCIAEPMVIAAIREGTNHWLDWRQDFVRPL
jgi:hypothetical protein